MTRNSSPLIFLVVFLTSFLHVSNISNYVLSLRLGYVQWHFWAVSIAACIVVGVFSGRIFKLPRLSLLYVGWVILFIAICILSLLLVNSGGTSIDGMIEYCWFFGVSLALVLIIRDPSDVKACGLGIVAAVTLLAVLSIMEFLDPNFQVIVDAFFKDKTEVGVVGRAGALYENSNDNGIAMVLGMFLGQFFMPVRLRFFFFILVGAAIFATVSRTSITVWAVAVVGSVLLGYGAKSKVLGFLGLGFVGYLGYLLVAGQVPIVVASLGLENLLSGGMTQRLSENFFTQQDGSTEARVQVVHDVWRLFVDNPLQGIGIGMSDNVNDVGTHNQHLKVASELGVFGFLVYVALGAIALIYSRSTIGVFFLFLYGLVGFTNHGMLNYTVHAVLLPTALVFIPAMQRFEVLGSQSSRKRRRRRSSSGVRSRDISEYA